MPFRPKPLTYVVFLSFLDVNPGLGLIVVQDGSVGTRMVFMFYVSEVSVSVDRHKKDLSDFYGPHRTTIPNQPPTRQNTTRTVFFRKAPFFADIHGSSYILEGYYDHAYELMVGLCRSIYVNCMVFCTLYCDFIV